MDVKKFYEEIGGNYEEAITRLMNDSLIEKFLKKFVEANYILPLKEAVRNADYDDLFFQAHTLKGVSLNLALVRLGKSASELTDYVRGDNKKYADQQKVETLFNLVLDEYNCVLKAYK